MGPGDPELVTVKGVRALEVADVIFAPVRRPGADSVALSIARGVADLTSREVTVLPFPTDLTHDGWLAVAASVVERLAPDLHGVFLTEGDPMLFGTFGHLVGALADVAPTLRVEIIPGVSSISAAAAAIPSRLGLREQSLAVLSGTAAVERIADTLRQFDSVVILKAGVSLEKLLDVLDETGRTDDAVYVRHVTRVDQNIVRDVRSLRADPPADYWALIVVQPAA